MNSTTDNIQAFITLLKQSVTDNSFIKLTLSNKRSNTSDLNNVYVKPVLIKEHLLLSFVDRYKTRDITRNLELEEAGNEIVRLLEVSFMQGYLTSTTANYHLLINKKGNSTLLKKPAASTDSPTLQHDKVKQRPITTTKNHYLQALGILNSEFKVRPDMQDKYRQINKYIEIIEGIIKEVKLPPLVHIADMGSGKGYLTFALYDYLTNQLKQEVEMTGVEFRKELVDKCNIIADEAGFKGLSFKEGAIETTNLPPIEMLIALHACDTATDEAIYRGIKAGAEIILCSPCCHKQVRRDMQTTGVLADITQFGILAERQAEIVTDTIRALTLEAYGYKTNIAEFIATEHTPKNLMISAVLKKKPSTVNPSADNPSARRFDTSALQPDPAVVQKINDLKAIFNVKSHHLQKILGF